MENGKTRSILNKPIGPLRMDNLMDIKENTFISTLKNGKIKLHGGTLPFKVILKSTLKKSIQNLQNFLTLMEKPDQLSKK